MLFDDTYQTLKETSEGIYREKGSKFIAYAYPIRQEAEVKNILANLRIAHPKARHFCWAFRLTPDRTIFRINDDGEPSGTAGRPILNTLLSADITNVLMIVVRYFGGTLLGVPGLINAYKNASVLAIQENTIVTNSVKDGYELSFGYAVMNDVMKIIKDEQLPILHQEFDNHCLIKMEVRKAQLPVVLSKFEKIPSVKLKYLFTS